MVICWCSTLNAREARVRKIEARTAVPTGKKHGRTAGYATPAERHAKTLRLKALRGRLARVERRIEDGAVSVARGGRRLMRGEARRLRGRAVAVFVSSSADSGFAASALSALPFWTSTGTTGGADALRRELECYAADHDVDPSFVHIDGDVASELLRLATELHADQIVVGQSMKARHRLAASVGCRLVGTREAPAVVVVP